jgi:hypothetical protein
MNNARRQNLKRQDEANGDNLEVYKQMIKESMALLENFELLKTTYYIHSSRKKAQSKLNKWVIKHDDVMAHLQRLFPEKKYSG